MTVLSALGQAALAYARRGREVFPCEERGKKPLCEHGLKDASTDEGTILAWWTHWPDANIGHPTGERVVVDVDGPVGEQGLATLERQHGPLPETLTARTGKGRHLYFSRNGVPVRSSAGRLGPHLDIRGEGGYVILPPSVHESGTRYEWGKRVKPAPLPEWIAALLGEPERPQASDPNASKKIAEGRRNAYLASIAGSMRRPGMTQAAIEAALLAENRERCDPPLAEGEVRTIAQSVSRYEPARPKQPDGFTLTRLGDLLAKPDVPVEYLVDGCLAAGTVSATVSKPKVGKSTLARNLCLAVARGEEFLSRKTKQGECIYLALEEREEDVRNDFRAMGADGREPILIHAAAAPAEGIRALCGLVRERKPRLVVIDPLFRLARIKDEKAYAETYSALGPLIDAAREGGTHVMWTHHSGKGLKADPIDSPLGSTAIAGAASTLLVLKRTEGYRTIQSVQRIGHDLPETVLQFDSETRRLSIGGTRFEAVTQECEEAILEFLRGAGEPKTQAEIRDSVEGATKVIRAALTALVESNRVRRSGDGMKGNPFRYECWFAGSQGTPGTSEPPTERVAETRVNTGPMLVPASEQNPMLVPANGETRKPALSARERALADPVVQGFAERFDCEVVEVADLRKGRA